MKQYLLDTNAVVDLLRDNKGPVARHIADVGISACAMCDITLYELYYGAYCSTNVSRNLEAVERLKSFIPIITSSDSFTEAAAQKARLRKDGQLIEDFDILIGCTAITTDRILVSDNDRHLGRLDGVKMENWLRD